MVVLTVSLVVYFLVFFDTIHGRGFDVDEQYLKELRNVFQKERERESDWSDERTGGGEYEDFDYKGVRLDGRWPVQHPRIGQVGGIAASDNGDLFVFQRNTTKWDNSSFDAKDNYAKKEDGPIKAATILVFNPAGEIVRKFGENRFYMPHGLTLDNQRNLWMTDVALHQVFKWPEGSLEPTLVLGEKFVPGTDETHFCKPTDIAVANNGDFFVADGYCNSRILKFSKDGKVLKQWGKDPEDDDNPQNDEFLIPHSLALIEDDDTICVADREDGRIQCFNAGIENPEKTGEFLYSIHDPQFGKVFAIEYDKDAGILYAVNGRTKGVEQVSGFTIDLDTRTVVDKWTPQRNGKGFNQPHDVTTNGKSVYVGEIGPNFLWKFDKNF